MSHIARAYPEEERREASAAIVSGFMSSVLNRLHSPGYRPPHLAAHITRLNLLISASILLKRPPFTDECRHTRDSGVPSVP